jgi:hypothetical protein
LKTFSLILSISLFSSSFGPFAQNGRVKAPDAGPEYLLHSEMGNPGSERAAPDKPAVLWIEQKGQSPVKRKREMHVIDSSDFLLFAI